MLLFIPFFFLMDAQKEEPGCLKGAELCKSVWNTQGRTVRLPESELEEVRVYQIPAVATSLKLS